METHYIDVLTRNYYFKFGPSAMLIASANINLEHSDIVAHFYFKALDVSFKKEKMC